MTKQQPQPSASKAEIRKHYFLESYVVIAPGRNLRPDTFAHPRPKPTIKSAKICPFDANQEPTIWQTPRGSKWQVKVIANAFPALTLANPQAFGKQEVVINTPSHGLAFSDLDHENILQVFAAYRQRLGELSQLDGIRYVLAFKNNGSAAGASINHAHCQIYALPLVPPKIAAESDALNHYWDSQNSCAYCDVVAWEQTQKVRLIARDKNFLALAPYASSHAFETWLIPLRHVNAFGDLTTDELNSLAIILKKITARLDSNSIDFNYLLQESLAHQDHHFVLKIEPRTTKSAGAEMGTGIDINPVAPEYAALWYRGKIAPAA